MGVTVFYRGALAEIARIEDMEDRVIDLALELGAHVQVWRSGSEAEPGRLVRGVIVDLAPGQETTSLLISPEGWLIQLADIERSEAGMLAEPGWCSVKTQFGSIEGHVALIELLAALKREFIPNLEVRDEAGYWETRDVQSLRSAFARGEAVLDLLEDGLRRHGLSVEAAEDPDILLARVERIVRQVQRTIGRPAEHPPVRFTDDDDEDADIGAGSDDEATWDLLFKENRRKQERMQRAIEERIHRGEGIEHAFENALRDELLLDLPGDSDSSDGSAEFDELGCAADEDPWAASLDDDTGSDVEDVDDSLEQGGGANAAGNLQDDGGTDLNGIADRQRDHPLQERAMRLMDRLHKLSTGRRDEPGGHWTILLRSAGEIMGGLAQALARDSEGTLRGLQLVQLKRALRGAAFALGALLPLHHSGSLDETVYRELRDTLQSFETAIYAELDRARNDRTPDW